MIEEKYYNADGSYYGTEKPEGYGIERSENHRIHAHVQKKPHGGSGIGIPTIPRGLSMPDGHLIVYLFC